LTTRYGYDVLERLISVTGTLDRLHEKGYISDPKSKAKSVVMTEEGAKRATELFEKHFMLGERHADQR